jgi:hypothetical protein
MLNGRTKQVSVIISIPTHSAEFLFEIVTSCLEELDRFQELDDLPLHWSFPARALETEDTFRNRLVPILRGRLAAGRDLLLPLGYSATPHSLLFPEDVQIDLDWARKNPWGSGISDIYPQASVILFPNSPDWLRGNVQSTYESETNALLLRFYDETARRSYYYLKTNTLLQLDGIHLNGSSKGLRQHLLRGSRASPRPALLIVEPLARLSPGNVGHAFEDIAASIHPRLDYCNMKEFTQGDGTSYRADPGMPTPGRYSSGMAVAPTTSTTPADVCSREISGYTRSQISASIRNIRSGHNHTLSTDAQTRDRLVSLASVHGTQKRGGPYQRPDVAPKDRTLIADMSGLVTLEGQELSAEFDDGRLTNVRLRGKPILCGGAARSSFTIEGSEPQHATSAGAFSFEGDRIHGLRSSQMIDGEGTAVAGSIIVDYFFMEGYRSLLISISCVFPVLEPDIILDSWSCFEMPIFSFPRGSSIRTESRLLNGEKYNVELSRSEVDYVLPGNSFCLRNDSHSVFVVLPETERNPLQLLPVRVAREGRRYTVLINPGGSYQSAVGSDLSGYAMRMVIALDIQDKSAERYPVIRSDIYGETGLPACGRYDSDDVNS